MNKLIPTLGLVGLVAIATSCQNHIIIPIENNTHIEMGKSNLNDHNAPWMTDSILKYNVDNQTIELYKKKKGNEVYVIVIDNVSIYREDALKSSQSADDSLFYAADIMWKKYAPIAKQQAQLNSLESAKSATSRIYNATDFLEK